MRCPKCDQVDFFRVDAWEVISYSAYLNNVEIETTKQQDTLHVAIESDSNASCMKCGFEAALSDFGPEFPFPILKRPEFEKATEPESNSSDLVHAIAELLACTDLNVENLDSSSIVAIENANRVLSPFKGTSQGGVA